MSSFDKVIGYGAIKAELIRICDVVKYPEKYFRLGVYIPRGILLYGDPGLGKTLLANCFIEESGRKCFTVRKDKPNGSFVDGIRQVFDKAKAEEAAIVFLDDLDKFANEDMDHCDADEYVTVQTCIDECKNKNVFVIATANDKDCMPDSLLRSGRFDKVIELEPLVGQEAKELVKYFLNQKKIVGDIDMDEIATIMEGRSSADIENVVNEAGIYAGFDGREQVSQEDILRSCMRMMFGATESVTDGNIDFIRAVAVHEAGHAVIAELLCPGSVKLISVCQYTGKHGGITQIRDEGRNVYSQEFIEANICWLLGGKAATEILLSRMDTGCTGDLIQAYTLVSQIVDDFCAYGFETFTKRRNYMIPTEEVTARKEKLVAQEMERYYQKAKRILAENRNFLDELVSELLERKTLSQKDIEELRARL